MICGTTYSVPTITEANCLRIGLALGNDFFNATVKCLALLLHSTETKSNCCQGNGREDSGRDLNHAIGEHRFLLATAVLVAGVLLGRVEGLQCVRSLLLVPVVLGVGWCKEGTN